jgi:hypothetical protein
MIHNRIRARCEKLVDDLDLPSPFDLKELCNRLGGARGRPIALLPIALPPNAPCGLWISTGDADYIFVEKRTSALHQLHIALHEIGHLCCEHATGTVMNAHTSNLLAPALDPQMVRHMLARSHYSAEAELEAETFACIALKRINGWSRKPFSAQAGSGVTELVVRESVRVT